MNSFLLRKYLLQKLFRSNKWISLNESRYSIRSAGIVSDASCPLTVTAIIYTSLLGLLQSTLDNDASEIWTESKKTKAKTPDIHVFYALHVKLNPLLWFIEKSNTAFKLRMQLRGSGWKSSISITIFIEK